METITLVAEWKPRPDYIAGKNDIEGKLTSTGSKVWYSPVLKIIDKPIPKITCDDEVLIKVRSCGICGSDVRLTKTDDEGYTIYSGLMSLPRVIGHELSGEIVEAGKNAINKTNNEVFKEGEPVAVESNQWCGRCSPCCEGFVNYCENIQSMGFNVDGGFAEYIKVKDKHCWSISALKKRYKGEDLFMAGALVEPTGTSYLAAIEIGGGIRPGDSVVVLGGGPIGLAAGMILKRAGATKLILSQRSKPRADIAKRMGFDHIINPVKENLADKILEYTDGIGAKLYIETTGSPHIVIKDIEDTIWKGKQLNSTIVLVSKSAIKIHIRGEVFQVRRANMVGMEGDTGHGIFPKIINLMADGMDLTPMVTSKVDLKDIPEKIINLQNNKKDCKVIASIF